MSSMTPESILSFWFEDIPPKSWWKKDPAFDAVVRARFHGAHTAAVRGELFSWRHNARGRLAEILVLDQFSRNMFRDSAAAFASDPLALVLAQFAIESGALNQLPAREAGFMLMPIMHSESLVVHEAFASYFTLPGLSGTLDYENKHVDILRRFGRYPHRNALLGRASTEDEVAFLQGPGSRF
ncbi:MAG: hypothetical protein JWR21_3642 [Herminiimonas sp.]|nr:hypothetical protein [Herminiimonas sp.]MDB5855562.1 hypothetical protein [Herminiimonas sp.]